MRQARTHAGCWSLGSLAPKTLLVKIRDLIKVIESDGWSQVCIRGSHRQYRHPFKKGRVTVPGHARDDVHPDTFRVSWFRPG
jgi:predicted RNA binding protein YcfA (HicA-like mRNA interferase family)